jgi:hypothetical protein
MKRQWQRIIDEDGYSTREEFIDIQDECVVIGVDYNAPELGYYHSFSHQAVLDGDAQAKSEIIKLFGESVYQEVIEVLESLRHIENMFKIEEEDNF